MNNKIIYTPGYIAEYLKEQIEFIKKNKLEMDQTSWGMEEGILISGIMAQSIVEFLLQQHGLIPDTDQEAATNENP